jgi:hypothetical protein
MIPVFSFFFSFLFLFLFFLQVVVLMGSLSDEEYCIKIAKHCKELGLICQLRVTSAHKGTEGTLQILSEYEGKWVISYDIYLYVCEAKFVSIALVLCCEGIIGN